MTVRGWYGVYIYICIDARNCASSFATSIQGRERRRYDFSTKLPIKFGVSSTRAVVIVNTIDSSKYINF